MSRSSQTTHVKSGNLSSAVCTRLTSLIAGLADECILRVRRGSTWWEGSNRAWAGPTTFAYQTHAFRTASISKTFTAALVLLLVEEGVLSLDDRLTTYLSNEICDQIHIYEGHSFGSDITIAQLLRHRSGVFDYATTAQFIESVFDTPAKKWSALDLLRVAIRAGTPYFRPDEGVAYSDTGYVLLALIIEAATGSSLASVYRERLLDPLALKSIYLEGCETATEWPVAHAFSGKIDTANFDPSFDTFGGGGLVSTAADLDHFITSLLGQAVFANEETLQFMKLGTDEPVGTGTRKTRTAAGISLFSISDTLFWGHLGHWNSFMLRSLETDIVICGTFNQANDDPRYKQILEAAVSESLSWDVNK